jgi:hypothetical protein
LSAARDTTGGLSWHWRAFWRQRRWRETTRLIAEWLDSTAPVSQHLLLIGGSAGWMMSSRWLQRFTRIDVVDLDPTAPRLFRFNHGRALRESGTELNFIQADGITGLDALLEAHPQATLFFDNVLGQHLYRVRSMERAEADLASIASRLSGRDWGSVHDLFSGPADPLALFGSAQTHFDALRDADGLVVEGLRGTPLHKRLLAQVGGKPDWMDHLTSELFPVGTPSRLIAWPFLPTYAHWLQAGWISGQSSDKISPC